jgi:hypothetical protein
MKKFLLNISECKDAYGQCKKHNEYMIVVSGGVINAVFLSFLGKYPLTQMSLTNNAWANNSNDCSHRTM